MVEMRERMVDLLVEATGQARSRIVADLDRDYIIRGEQAVEYGAVDHILTRGPHEVAAALRAEPGM